MDFFGLSWLDAAIVALYVVVVLLIGNYLASRVKGEADFFLAGRKLGKWFQFFLNFGNMAGDPSSAALTAASVYSQGVGGVWLGLIQLFTTPYYWFMNPWFRRVRLTTIADLFEDRFGKRFLASLFAIVSIVLAPLLIGFSNVVAFKTLEPIMAKPETAYTDTDRQTIANYDLYRKLHGLVESGTLPRDQQQTYDTLRGFQARGELKSYASYIEPLPFYIASSLLVCVFIMMGGLEASAIVDAIQSILVILMSVILIPFGLVRLGGLHALHEKVPDYMFQLFGSASTSEYTWYSIGSFFLLGFIGITAAPANMNISGSARNEMAARLGALGGGFAKRIVTIAWCFCGLIAVALFGPNMADPDQTWGILARTLLPVGFIGVMLVAMLGGKLAALGATSIVVSALSVKNIYEPLFPGRSESHYMVVARAAVPIILALGIVVALYIGSALSLFKTIVSLSVVWGAPILVIFLWRRLTETAVRVQVIFSLLLIGVLPLAVSAIAPLRQSPALTITTEGKTVALSVRATQEDVKSGLATSLGQPITRQHRIEPVAVYFEDGLARIDPTNPESPKEGVGRFNVEIYLLALLGLKLTAWTPAQLLTARYLVDSFAPFVLLFGVSLMTKPTDPDRVNRFYARMQTPVGATPEEDAREVQKSYQAPHRFADQKLFPRSDWEFMKWGRIDVIGFSACCGVVVLILLFFTGVLLLGA
jgi:Na+/proline symporter